MAILVEASVGGGAYASGLITVVSGNVVQLRLNPNTSGGVSSVLWEITEYPTGAALPAGWTDSGAGSWNFSATALTGLAPPSITMPAQWGKYLVRATANNGVWGGSVDYANARDETCALSMLSPRGVENIAATETTQSNERGALGVVKTAIETLEPFVPPSGATAGQIAISDGAGGWDADDPAAILRTGYDSKISNIAVAADVLENWFDLWALTRTTLVNVDEGCVSMDLKFTVKDNDGALPNTKDVVTIRATYRRHDHDLDAAVNIDDGVASRQAAPEITWTLNLPTAAAAGGGPLFEVRIILIAAAVHIQCRQHATIDRRIWAELHYGNLD